MGLLTADIWTGSSKAAALAVALVLAGCATPKPAAPPKAPPPAPAPVPPPQPAPPPAPQAQEPEESFAFNRDGAEASLAHGIPDSDVLDLMMSCRRGVGRVTIRDTWHSEAKKGQILILASGTAHADLPVEVEADEAAGGVIAKVIAPLALPALQEFRANGTLSLRMGAQTLTLAAHKADMPAVTRFFAFCHSAPKVAKRR